MTPTLGQIVGLILVAAMVALCVYEYLAAPLDDDPDPDPRDPLPEGDHTMTHAENVEFADAALSEIERHFVHIDTTTVPNTLDRTTLDYAAQKVARMRVAIKEGAHVSD